MIRECLCTTVLFAASKIRGRHTIECNFYCFEHQL